MPRKAKPTKHSTKELNKRKKLATQDRGGGKAGRDARGGGKTGGARYQCYICKLFIPDEKTMQIHFDSKHAKLTMDMERCRIIDCKKDHDAKRVRIANQGPMLSAGKKMKRGAKKEMKNQMRQDKKRGKAKSTAPTPSPTKVSAESIISIPEPTATSLIENSSEQPKKKKKKKKKKDKEGENGVKTEKKKKKKKKKKDKEDSGTGGGKAKEKTKDSINILGDASAI